MKGSDIRELGIEEVELKIKDLKEEVFNLRFQHGTGQLENPMKLKQAKRDVARLNTILNEKHKS
jgi:large subunit ribosomal protein L29